MSIFPVTINAPVGLRDGTTMLPNNPNDLNTITALLDRITSDNGGTADVPGQWAVDRGTLIQEVADAIAQFQSGNSVTVDSAVDPRGRTLTLMNQLAQDPPLVAQVSPLNNDLDVVSPKEYASPSSVYGTRPLENTWAEARYSRFLVSLAGSSIKWFGVVIPTDVFNSLDSAVTHIFFTPTPDQHTPPAIDSAYDAFGQSWVEIWDAYTTTIGGLVALTGLNHIVVIPHYKYSQTEKMGGFLSDWSDAITVVVQAAIGMQNPNIDATAFSVGSVVSSSFSNGIRAHMHFQIKGVGTTAVTNVMFDLDGGASGTVWAPSGMVTYRNVRPTDTNPIGLKFLVGSRWQNFQKFYPKLNTHSACCMYLLMHGVSTYC